MCGVEFGAATTTTATLSSRWRLAEGPDDIVIGSINFLCSGFFAGAIAFRIWGRGRGKVINSSNQLMRFAGRIFGFGFWIAFSYVIAVGVIWKGSR